MTEHGKKALSEFKEQYPKYKVIMLVEIGSKLFGTNSATSDVDYRGVFIPSKDDVILKRDIDNYKNDTAEKDKKNTSDDVDFELWSIYKLLKSLKSMDTNAVDLVFAIPTDNCIIKTPEADLIFSMRNNFLNNSFKAFFGYANKQIKQYQIKGKRYNELSDFVNMCNTINDKGLSGVKLEDAWLELQFIVESQTFEYIKFIRAPGANKVKIDYISVLGKLFHKDVKVPYFLEKVNNLFKSFGDRTKSLAANEDNIDYKGLSHSFRILDELEELVDTGNLIFPLRNREYIKKIKAGNCDYKVVLAEIEDMIDRIEIKALSSMFDEFNEHAANLFLLSVLEK